MRQFLLHLAGGCAVILVSLLAGIAHNTFDNNKIELFPSFGRMSTAVAALSDSAGAPAAVDSTLSAVPADTASLSAHAAGGIQGAIPLDKARALFDGKSAVFIDARGVEAYDEGHIPGAINIPYDQLTDYYETLTATVPLEQLVVVYCWSPTCDFSENLASEMSLMGYSDMVIYRGGWDEWHAAGLPAEGINME